MRFSSIVFIVVPLIVSGSAIKNIETRGAYPEFFVYERRINNGNGILDNGLPNIPQSFLPKHTGHRNYGSFFDSHAVNNYERDRINHVPLNYPYIANNNDRVNFGPYKYLNLLPVNDYQNHGDNLPHIHSSPHDEGLFGHSPNLKPTVNFHLNNYQRGGNNHIPPAIPYSVQKSDIITNIEDASNINDNGYTPYPVNDNGGHRGLYLGSVNNGRQEQHLFPNQESPGHSPNLKPTVNFDLNNYQRGGNNHIPPVIPYSVQKSDIITNIEDVSNMNSIDNYYTPYPVNDNRGHRGLYLGSVNNGRQEHNLFSNQESPYFAPLVENRYARLGHGPYIFPFLDKTGNGVHDNLSPYISSSVDDNGMDRRGSLLPRIRLKPQDLFPWLYV